jgi:hypothetical protein
VVGLHGAGTRGGHKQCRTAHGTRQISTERLGAGEARLCSHMANYATTWGQAEEIQDVTGRRWRAVGVDPRWMDVDGRRRGGRVLAAAVTLVCGVGSGPTVVLTGYWILGLRHYDLNTTKVDRRYVDPRPAPAGGRKPPRIHGWKGLCKEHARTIADGTEGS